MAGLRMICKAYGGMTINGVKWIWDYAKDEPVREDELKAMAKEEREKRRAESEKAKWARVSLFGEAPKTGRGEDAAQGSRE
jgi:hypothetical protein